MSGNKRQSTMITTHQAREENESKKKSLSKQINQRGQEEDERFVSNLVAQL